MPHDMYDDEDELKADNAAPIFKEFDCPSCSANNPADPPLTDEGETICNYCGTEFRVRISDAGRLKLKEL